MDHPNIAKVLDAGATEMGRPDSVMELVMGVSITEYGTVEDQVREWNATVAVCKHSRKRWLPDISVQRLWLCCETTPWGSQKIVAVSMSS